MNLYIHHQTGDLPIMPRPPLPTAIHEAKGTYVQHPERRRADEPQPKAPIGEPPGRLNDEERSAWCELLEILPDGVATIECRWALERLVRLIVKSWKGVTAAWEEGLIRSYIAGFGMTPADRAKVHVKPALPRDEWDDLDGPSQ
jgi:hypothetical protein